MVYELGSIRHRKIDIQSQMLCPRSKMSLDTIIENQATINIGTIGHVAHGKSTLVRALSGIHTVRFKNELERNITIKLGYANAKIYKCQEQCQEEGCPHYTARGSGHPSSFFDETTQGWMVLKKHVSFVDCPGHDLLMATMLNGASVMDAAILMIAGNEPFPQPQTTEHLAAIEMMQLEHLLVLQNKIDLVSKEDAILQYAKIRKFLEASVGLAPVFPISAQVRYNIDAVCRHIVENIPVPKRDLDTKPRMVIVRSFDINKPGTECNKIQGGIAGGSILQGVFQLGQEIEVRPGHIYKENGKLYCRPLRSKILSLFAEKNKLEFAVPGGLVGVGTDIDPGFTRGDKLVGHMLGIPGHLPSVFNELEIHCFLLHRVLGEKEKSKIQKLYTGEQLMLSIGSSSVGGIVLDTIRKAHQSFAKIELTAPICVELGDKLAISRKAGNHWRLIGWGFILNGTKIVE